MNNVLLFIGALLVVTLAALFAVPHFVDWSVYRSTFETQAGKLIGRDVRVGGRVSLRLLPAPYVSFENVRVADQDGRFSEPPLRVDAFTLWLSIPPLLRGSVEASEVDLRRPELLVRVQGAAKPGEVAPPVAVLPVSIALRSVSVKDGLVRVLDAAGQEKFKIEKLTGEFAAPSLDGPFRFRGTLQHGGRDREVRIATGKLEPDGGLAVEGSVRVAEQASSYQLKGRVQSLTVDPSFVGDVLVQPTVDRSAKARQSAQAGKGTAERAEDLLPFFEIKSKLRIGLRDARLDDLSVLFEQAGRPQLMSGNASATFTGDTRVSVTLDARWLDLDLISGSDGKSGPQAALARLGRLAQTWLPAGIATDARLGIEQATLGAESINRVALAARQGNNSLEVTNLSAELPGGGRVRLSGTVQGMAEERPATGAAATPTATPVATPGDGPRFEGPLQLHGQNLKRFLAWATAGADLGLEETAGAFNLNGRLALSRDRLALTQVRGELGVTAFEASASVARGAPGKPVDLVLAVDSDRLDLRPFIAGNAKLEDFWLRLHEAPPQAAAPRPRKTGHASPIFEHLAGFNSDVRLRIGRLMLPEIELRDLEADVARAETNTTVRALRFTASTGLKMQADGQLLGSEGRARGALKAFIELDRPEALDALLRFVDIPEAHVLQARGPSLMPLRLAGIATFGARGGSGFELRLDGAAHATRTSVVVRGDQEPTNWRTGVLDVTGSFENPTSAQLLTQMLPGTTAMSVGAGDPARLSLRANGVPKSGISTAIELETKAVEAGFSGTIALPGDQASMAGEIGLKAADVADGLRLAGLKTVRALQGRDLVLHTRMSAKGGEIVVQDAALRLGSASAEASGRIKRGEGRLTIDATAKTANASLPALLAIALGTSPGAAASSSDATVWADDPIDLSALGDIGGKVRLEAQDLSLGHDLHLRKATTEFVLGADAVEIKSLTGEAMGGRVSASARAQTSQKGVAIQGTARFDGLQFDRLVATPQSTPAASGSADVTATFSGRGITPRGVLGTLTGSGKVDLKNVRLAKFGAEALDAAVMRALTVSKDEAGNEKEPSDVKVDPETFKSLIVEELTKAPLMVGTRSVALEIGDGTIRAKPLAFDVTRGKAKATAILDLNTLRFDSEWSVETATRFPNRPRSAGQGAPKTVEAGGSLQSSASAAAAALQVPGIGWFVSGPLADLPRIEPRLDTAALARELFVRRMELDVELLERARKKREDEEQKRQKDREDAEARRKQEEAQAATAAREQVEKASAGPQAPPTATTLQAPLSIVPAPVPVSSPPAAGQPPGAPPTKPDAVLDEKAQAAPPAPTSPTPASPPPASPLGPQPKAAAPIAPPSKLSRPPSVFDQSRGL